MTIEKMKNMDKYNLIFANLMLMDVQNGIKRGYNNFKIILKDLNIKKSIFIS